MSDVSPSFFLLAPGPWTDATQVIDVLARRGLSASPASPAPLEPGEFRVEVVHEPRGFAGALSHGRRGRLPPRVLHSLSECRYGALIEVGGWLDAHRVSLAELGRALQQSGGLGVRTEASGCASEWEPWVQMLESPYPLDWVDAVVLVVGSEEGALFTCGMHAFGLPDAQARLADSAEAIEWLDALCAYQLAERPALVSGHSFRPDADRARRRVERWPDHRHRRDDGRHNPFGLWRLVEEDDAALEPLEVVPVFIPALRTILLSAEQARGRPLTREEVESIRDTSSTIAMAPTDLASLERRRGYADLEPRRVWEQWSLIRAAS